MVRKYAALLRMKYMEMLAYRLATIVWMTGAITQPLITMAVWINIDPSQSDAFFFLLYGRDFCRKNDKCMGCLGARSRNSRRDIFQLYHPAVASDPLGDCGECSV